MPLSLAERNMDTIKESQERWSRWMREERHISDEVSQAAGCHMIVRFAPEECLEIPVFNEEGERLFSKFRRAPWLTDGPKYQYEKGSTAALFGAELLKGIPVRSRVVITEGELDALALRTLGYHAFSSTGGAGTWKEAWSDKLSMFDVVLLYDADRAGVEGALKVASTMKHAHIAWLPVEHGKDPTEVIHSGHVEELKACIDNASNYELPQPTDDDEERLKALLALQGRLFIERQEANMDRNRTPFHRDIALDWVNDRVRQLKDRMWEQVRPQRKNDTLGAKIADAKQSPIREMIKVTHDGFAQCVYHEEKSASMKVYADNHAFSYCCSVRSSAIDIYMALHSCSFKEAVEKLSP